MLNRQNGYFLGLKYLQFPKIIPFLIFANWISFSTVNVIIFGPIDDARDSLIDESDLNMPRETMELLFSRQQHTIRWKRPCV